jgi:23S rRNA (uracil1939-C5)-methyltransferase
MTLRPSPLPSVGGEGAFALGFHVPQRYDKILDINECHLQSDLSNGILNAVRDFALDNSLPVYTSEPQSGYLRNLVIREGKNTGDVMVNLVTFDDRPDEMEKLTSILTKAFPEIVTVVNNITSKRANVAVGEIEKVYYGSGVISEKIGSHVFHLSANSFLQTNTRQAETLYAITKEYAELKLTDVVYDLYCGTGAISIYISDAVKQVVGIELIESSIANARMNAAQNGITNCEFIAGDLKDLLTKDVEWKKNYAKPDVLIVDPPRSGMHPKAVKEIGEMKIPRVVYVSCNPATLARDLQMLAPFGYSIEKVQPVDMFPHTYHIESVVRLKLI